MKHKLLNLPDKMSDLLQYALNHMLEAETEPGVVIDMSMWHTKDKVTGKCYMCLAGSIMRKLPHLIDYTLPDDFDKPVGRKLLAIDRLRVGGVSQAFRLITGKESDLRLNREITPYHEDREAFISDIRKLIDDLRANNL